MTKEQAEVAIRAFFLYEKQYYRDEYGNLTVDAFELPSWYNKAADMFTRKEKQAIWNEINGVVDIGLEKK